MSSFPGIGISGMSKNSCSRRESGILKNMAGIVFKMISLCIVKQKDYFFVSVFLGFTGEFKKESTLRSISNLSNFIFTVSSKSSIDMGVTFKSPRSELVVRVFYTFSLKYFQKL